MTSPKPPWLANLPHTWKSANLGHVARVGTGSADVQDSDDNGAYPFVVRSPRLLRLETYTHDTEAVLTAGDGNVGEIFHHLKGKFAAHQRVYVIEPGPELHGRYLYYAMRGTFLNSLQGNTAKSTVESLRRPMLTGFTIPVPLMRHQKRIADYLDHETAEIDNLIFLLNTMDSLLWERFEATWSERSAEAVRDFKSVKVRHLVTSLVDGPFGSALTSSHYSDNGAPVVRLGNIGRMDFKMEPRAYIPLDYALTLQSHDVHPGDVVIAGLGDAGHPLGRAAVVPPEFGHGIVKADCYRARTNSAVTPDFLAWSLSSSPSGNRFREESRGSTRSRLNLSIVHDTPVALPDIAIQHKIIEDFKRRSFQAQITHESIQSAIELARERRAALITAAVTGQIDVTARNKPAAEQLEDDIAQGLHREN